MTDLAVTGSSGHVGGQVAHLVADLRPRLVVRDPARAPAIDGSSSAHTVGKPCASWLIASRT